MRYCVRVTFSAPSDIADATFLEALETCGLLRLSQEAGPLSFDLMAPASVSLGNQGYWASVTAERLEPLRDDWTVTAVAMDTAEVN